MKYKQYDYIYKYLDFDKLDKDWFIHFNDKQTEEWFRKTFINSEWLCVDEIQEESSEGYEYLKKNWGKDIFRIAVCYPDKQELKTIVNKVINIKLIRG